MKNDEIPHRIPREKGMPVRDGFALLIMFANRSFSSRYSWALMRFNDDE
jgi:hypothetical protein